MTTKMKRRNMIFCSTSKYIINTFLPQIIHRHLGQFSELMINCLWSWLDWLWENGHLQFGLVELVKIVLHHMFAFLVVNECKGQHEDRKQADNERCCGLILDKEIFQRLERFLAAYLEE